MSDIVDTGIVYGDFAFVVTTGGYMLCWAAGNVVADLLNSLCAARAAMGLGRELRGALYKRVASFGIHEIDGFGTSSLITRTTNDCQQLERFAHMSMTIAMMSPIMLVGAAIATWNANSDLALIVFAAIPVLIVVSFVVMKLVMPYLRSLQRRIDKLNRVTREGLTGIRVIRAYRREPYEEERFSQANHELAETNVAVARRMSALMPGIQLILNIAIIIIVWVAAGFVDVGSFQVGSLMALIQYSMQVLISVTMLSMVFMIWPRAQAAAERILEVLDTEPTIKDNRAARELTPEEAEAPHEIAFDHVSFRFPGAERDTLSDLDFTLERGRTYALIGSTGSGKSTVINLLERFDDPTKGRVLLDGIDISELTQESLHEAISYVPQKTTLFAGTLADNIRYGNEDASDEEVVAAAKAAAAYDFIMDKEDGFETRITQAGSGLSGGQKQRVAIARALAKRAGLYLFDDSFSALDFKTDALVRSNLSSMTKNATVLIVAQRVSVAMDADEVIVLDGGRVDAIGTHEELLEKSEVYREIVASQITEEEAR
jgi:ATP-binding cassette subfamily B multidrug efflux pump